MLPGRGLWSLPLVSDWTSCAERLTDRLEPGALELRGGHERFWLSARSSDEWLALGPSGPAPGFGLAGGIDCEARLCGESPGREGWAEISELSGGTEGRVRPVGESGVEPRVASGTGGTVERCGMLSGG